MCDWKGSQLLIISYKTPCPSTSLHRQNSFLESGPRLPPGLSLYRTVQTILVYRLHPASLAVDIDKAELGAKSDAYPNAITQYLAALDCNRPARIFFFFSTNPAGAAVLQQ